MIHEELSHSDFKTRLIDNLNKTGIRDKLKSQLRSKLYSELTLKTRIPQEQTRSSNLLSNVIDSLFVQYLKSQGFEFSLAVFLPECGLAPHQLLNEEDVICALHLKNTIKSILPDKNSKDVLIMRMLKGIHTLTDFQMVEKEVQTNLEIDDLMHIKIRDIDKSFRSKEKNYEKSQIAALEERLYSCQREIEVRSEAQLQEQISNFKQFELAKLKLEERKSYQIEMDRQKMEFERKLVEQEAKHVEQMQKEQQRLSFREKEFDRQNTLLRQQLLDENNRVVLKESKLKNEAELNSKQYEMERDQLRRRIQEAQEQLKEVGDFKERYSQKMEEAIAQYKIDLNKEYASMKSSLEIDKVRVDSEKRLLSEKESMLNKMQSRMHNTEEECARYKMELEDAIHRIEDITKAREEAVYMVKDLQLQLLTQRGSESLEFEINSLRKQLAAAETASSQRQKEHEEMVKSLMNPKEEMKDELKKTQENEMKWKNQCQQLIIKLDTEFANYEQLSKKFDRQRLKIKELERELADKNVLLHQSNTALSILQEKSNALPMLPNTQPLFDSYLNTNHSYRSAYLSEKRSPSYNTYSNANDGLENRYLKLSNPMKFDNYEPFEHVTVPDSHQNNAFIAPQCHATTPERRHFSPTQPSRVSEIHESVNHNALDKHDLIPINDLDISQNQSQSDAIHKPVAPTVFSRHRTNISADSRNQKSPGEENIKKQEAVDEPQLNQSSIPKDCQTQFLRNATNPSNTNEQFSQRSNETSIQAKTIRNRTIPLKIAEPMNLNMKSPPTSESSVLVSTGKGEQNNPAPFTNAKQSDLDSSNKAEKMAQIQRDHEIENYEQKRLEREMERKKRDEQERQRILKEKLELDRKEELQKLKRIQEEKNRPMELNNNKSIKDVSVKQDVKIADETKKKEDAMSSIKALEKDPIMQKYLNLVKEKRGLNNESILDPKVEKSKKPEEIDTAFGAGDTADEFSAPDNNESSGDPSW